jgi:single-stranded DNA-binding protein
MSINALVTGKLAASPQQRTSQRGNPFATARIKLDGKPGEPQLWCSVIAFDTTAVEALMGLCEGDGVSMTGELKVATFTDKQGQVRPSLDLTANRVMSLKDAKRPRRSATQAPRAPGEPVESGQWQQPGYEPTPRYSGPAAPRNAPTLPAAAGAIDELDDGANGIPF